ncbi:MAG TPA: HPr kinase/phosphorylase [Clostridiales bacterium]|nr:HPr kinase/phosphorylase [Clostridiales bacterium]
MKSISINKIITAMNLEIIHIPESAEMMLYNSELLRPGLQLAGFFDTFAYERIQIIGKTETHYIETLTGDLKANRIDKLFAYPLPAVIVTSGMKVDPVLVYCAKKHGRVLLRTQDKSTKLISNLMNFLEEMLAPEKTIHGVVMEVYGVGVLLRGQSGIGKSETALELIKRGHRLVADDAVVLSKIDNVIYCASEPITRHLLEIRGIGIIDVKHLYGVGSVKIRQKLGLIVDLEEWSDKKYYDRLGFDNEFEDIFDIKINRVTIPVRPGRNIATIVEVASMNLRQKLLGYSMEDEFNRRVEDLSGYEI